MKIIGHRGASEDAPENTLESLQLAWEQGAYAAECDIIRTRDGKLILMHDDSTKRTALHGEDLLVEDTKWHGLKDLDVGSWKDQKWQGVKIPLLEEVLRAIPDGKHLYIEIKSGKTNLGADERVIDDLEEIMVKEEISPGKITFICFDHNFLNRLKKRLPSYNACYLTSYIAFPGRWPNVRNVGKLESYIDEALANDIDGLDLESSSVITGAWVKKIHNAGLKVTIWSYAEGDTLDNALRYQEMGVDFLTTNTPAKILSELALHSTPNGSNSSFGEEDYLHNGKLTPPGIEYLSRFKRFNLFSRARTVLLFTICLPITIPLAILRLLALFVVTAGGICLKKYLAISLDDYPKIINIIYFLCLGVYIRAPEGDHSATSPDAAAGKNGSCTVIVTNHHSRFDAMLLANLHQADATYRAAAKISFFGKLLIASGLCSRAMEEGLALDTKEGREEFRRRLEAAYSRPLLFFPEGRVVQKPKTIMTFQNHLLQGQKVNILCRESSYRSYFLDHTQIEIPFFKAPYSRFKNKLLWDSLIEGFPFLISLATVFETKVIGTVELAGSETLEEIDAALYSTYFDNGFSLVSIDPLLAKKLLHSLYL
jgi:glycerophosphoryl diester phosphodiesterase